MSSADDQFEIAILNRIREAVDAVRSKVGVVQTYSAPTMLTVLVNGTTVTLHRLASYTTPVNGDKVLVDCSVSGQWVVLGKII